MREFEKLGNLISISKGKMHRVTEAPSESSVRLIQIDDLRNNDNLKFTDDKRGVFATKDDLLIVWDGANAGTIGYEKRGLIGSTIALLKKKHPDKWDTKFLGRFLQSKFNYLRSRATGATIPHINKKSLEELRVPVFQLQDQTRISTLLSGAVALIAKRRESLDLLDELYKSTFVEMFGNPVRNEKRWEKTKMLTYINNISAGTSFGGEAKNTLDEDELGVLKISAVTTGKFNPMEFKAVKREKIKRKIIFLKKGDLLFSRANTRDLVAATCIVDDDYPKLFLPDKLWRIELDEKICNKHFFDSLFKNKCFRKSLTKKATGTSGSMLNISMSKLISTETPIPPINLQSQFAKIIEKIELLKAQYQTSLIELENLYGGFSQRAFRGELDLSKIPKELEAQEKAAEQNEQGIIDDFAQREIPFSPDFIKEQIIKRHLNHPFSFNEFWQAIRDTPFEPISEESEERLPEEMQLYETMKKTIFQLLVDEPPFLTQFFEETDKRVALRVNP